MLGDILAKETIIAVYTVQNSYKDIKKLAEKIAVGQTLGAWDSLPGKTRLNISKHLAEVISVEESEYSSTIKIAFPIINFGSDIAAMLTAIFGKISLAPKIKLEDIEISDEYVKLFQGPKLGISGTRKLIGVNDRPLVMSIFKPCLGISTQELGEMFLTQAEAGIDLVKDDEILYDNDFNLTLKRLEACLKAKEKANAKTLYAINLTGEATEIIERAKTLEKNGANCILFNYISYGFPLLKSLSKEVNIPIMAHPAFAGAMCGNAYSGLSETILLGKLPRLAGADFVLFPSPYGSLAWEKEITLDVNKHLTSNLPNINKTWSVPSAGIKPEMVSQIHTDFGSDIIINAGTGVWEHPSGGKSGAQSFINEVSKLSPTAVN